MSFNLWETVVTIVNFLILLWIMKFLLFRPLNRTMQARKATIEGNIAAAEQVRAEVETMKNEVLAERNASKQAAQEIVSRAEKAGEAARADIIEEARTEAEKIIAKARLEIEDEKQKALMQIRGEAADLALTAAARLLSRSLDDTDHRELVNKYIEEAGEVQ